MGLGRKTRRKAENWIATLIGLLIAIVVLALLVLGILALLGIVNTAGL